MRDKYVYAYVYDPDLGYKVRKRFNRVKTSLADMAAVTILRLIPFIILYFLIK